MKKYIIVFVFFFLRSISLHASEDPNSTRKERILNVIKQELRYEEARTKDDKPKYTPSGAYSERFRWLLHDLESLIDRPLGNLGAHDVADLMLAYLDYLNATSDITMHVLEEGAEDIIEAFYPEGDDRKEALAYWHSRGNKQGCNSICIAVFVCLLAAGSYTSF